MQRTVQTSDEFPGVSTRRADRQRYPPKVSDVAKFSEIENAFDFVIPCAVGTHCVCVRRNG